MFPLATTTTPTTGEALAIAIRGTLSNLFSFHTNGEEAGDVVEAAAGDEDGRLRELHVRLDGATVRATRLPAKPVIDTAVHPASLLVERLTLSARPLHAAGARLDLAARCAGVTFSIPTDADGRPLLVLCAVEEANVSFEASRADLNAVATAVAGAAAKAHGVDVDDVDINLKSEGPVVVRFDVRVRAKKMLLRGTVQVSGRVTIDDQARLLASDLTVTGQGVIGAMAAAVARPKLQGFSGRPISLVAFSPTSHASTQTEVVIEGDRIRANACIRLQTAVRN